MIMQSYPNSQTMYSFLLGWTFKTAQNLAQVTFPTQAYIGLLFEWSTQFLQSTCYCFNMSHTFLWLYPSLPRISAPLPFFQWLHNNLTHKYLIIGHHVLVYFCIYRISLQLSYSNESYLFHLCIPNFQKCLLFSKYSY